MSSLPGANGSPNILSRSPYAVSRSCLASFLAVLALLLLGWGSYLLDLPVIRFIRSLQNQLGIHDHLWLARWSDWGDWVGKGDVLFTISGLLLIVGFVLKQPRFRMAGIESAVAHAVVGLLGLALKYGIGRPRPKFMHGDEWVLAPSLESGMHSFPSGHSSASFAVAVVLAKYFPRMAWVVYGLAAMIAMSRVVRGAHFPSDVVVGMVFGMLVGAVVCDPMANRWHSVKDMLGKAAVGIGVLVSILWVATHVPQAEAWRTFSRNIGILLVVGGAGVRIAQLYELLPKGPRDFSPQIRDVLIGLGLVISTGSYLVMLVGLLLVMTHVLNQSGPTPSVIQKVDLQYSKERRLVSEGLIGVSAVGSCLFLQGITGIVPFF